MSCRFFFDKCCGFHGPCIHIDDQLFECKWIEIARRYEIEHQIKMEKSRSSQ